MSVSLEETSSSLSQQLKGNVNITHMHKHVHTIHVRTALQTCTGIHTHIICMYTYSKGYAIPKYNMHDHDAVQLH